MRTNNILSDFQFMGSSVRRIEVQNNFVIFSDTEEYSKEFDVDFVIENIDDGSNSDIQGLLTLNVSIDVSDGKDHAFSCRLEILGAFISEPKPQKNDFSDMLSLNGCATLYSIARALIMTLSSQTFSSGSIVLPMINLFKVKEEKTLEKS